MKKASRTTYKVGSIAEFAAWTKRVVSDPRAALEHPKKWFGSEEAAAHAEQVSAEAMGQAPVVSQQSRRAAGDQAS
jgi:hypothetical protein